MLFDEFVGGDAHISMLNRKNIREWKTELFRWPVKAADARKGYNIGTLRYYTAGNFGGSPEND